MIGDVRDDPTTFALVERARDGDQGAWEQIVARFAPLVWALCRHYRLSPADIDDIGASVWLRLVEGLDTIRDPAALPGWLATTTRRECVSLLRVRRREIFIDHDPETEDFEPASDEWLLRQERYIALRVAFEDLPPHCKELLSLVFADPPIPYATISARTGRKVGSIGPNRQRCLDRLRRSPAMAALLGNEPAGTEGR